MFESVGSDGSVWRMYLPYVLMEVQHLWGKKCTRMGVNGFS